MCDNLVIVSNRLKTRVPRTLEMMHIARCTLVGLFFWTLAVASSFAEEE